MLIPVCAHLSINRTILECKDRCKSVQVGINVVLIEPYWNVKKTCLKSQLPQPRINRTILECKDEYVEMANRGEMVLIEPYWNVKRQNITECHSVIIVLIEPYWNVKYYAHL